MVAIAVERIDVELYYDIRQYLKTISGPQSPDTWYTERDYDLEALVMSKELYLLYKLKFSCQESLKKKYGHTVLP